jgi:hypothetical protein
MPRHPRNKVAKPSGNTEAEPGKKDLSPEVREIARLLISSLGPIASLLDAISRLH